MMLTELVKVSIQSIIYILIGIPKTLIIRRKKDRSIQNKIENVIDDRGSDLSSEENYDSPAKGL